MIEIRRRLRRRTKYRKGGTNYERDHNKGSGSKKEPG